MEKINLYGWKSYRTNNQLSETHNANEIGRVLSVKGHQYHIITNEGGLSTELLGRLLVACEKEEQPKVGDWIKFIKYDETSVFISEVLPRVNQLYRKTAGRENAKQVLATNLDTSVIVQGLDHDFNLNRLERYLVQIASCGIKPVVVLNKSDLVDNINEYIQEVEKLQRNVDVYTCSTLTGDGVETMIKQVFKPDSTNVLIGSSGVGKSSLINALQNEEVRDTGSISSATSKGKHTTTTRDLLLMDNGAMIIDTPGMREFGLGYEEEGDFSEQFPVISQYAEDCKYNDCTHIDEQGCAVLDAYESGEMEAIVYENYVKLIKEQHRFQTSTHEKNKEGKRFGKMVREAKEMKKRYKGR